MFDLVIVGAGPIGLEAAIRAKRAGLRYLVLEKGCIVNAIYNYPTYMTFFTTSERLEIGGHPLVTTTDKPTRKEALEYYRKVVHNEALNVRTYTEVTALERTAGEPSGEPGFVLSVRASDRRGGPAGAATDDRESDRESDGESVVRARRVALATGYFDNPKLLGIPGEARADVSHYYTEAHPFYNRNVTIVGAGSSAADAALDLFKGGANVTMIHRGDDFRHSLKYWIRPNLENRVKEGSITAHFNTEVREIRDGEVVAERADGSELRIPTDQCFLLTGYAASTALLEALGVELDPDTKAARLDPDTFESNVPGLYLIGSAGFGERTSDVFIENGLVHARKALEHIVAAHETEAATEAASASEGAGKATASAATEVPA